MAIFSVRVELHFADAADYKTLATKLATTGITDVITAADGKKYKLPPAEYNIDSKVVLKQVYQVADTIAASIGKRYAIVVSETAGRIWNGLELA